MKKYFSVCLTFFSLIFLFAGFLFISASQALAQCGTAPCCYSTITVNTPPGCNPNCTSQDIYLGLCDPYPCTGTSTTCAIANLTCSTVNGQSCQNTFTCAGYMTGGCSGSCSWGACTGPCGPGNGTQSNTCGAVVTCTAGLCPPSPTPAPTAPGGTPPPPPPPTPTPPPGSCGTPAAPGGLTPANNANVNITASKNVTLSWAVIPKATLYNVEIYPSNTPAGQECSGPDTHCRTNDPTLTYTVTLTPVYSSYTWRVQGVNSTCSPTTIGTWTTNTFNVQGNITGGFFNDPNHNAVVVGNLCQLAGAAPQAPGAGGAISATTANPVNTATGTITGTTYTINNVYYDTNTSVDAVVNPANWHCTCPVGCSYSGVSAPASGVNFFLTNASTAWWSSINGLLYAAAPTSTAVLSQIPTICGGSPCAQALSMRTVIFPINSEGFTMTGGGSIQSTYDPAKAYSDLRQDATTPRVTSLTLNSPHEDYNYFYDLYSMGATTPAVDFSGPQPGAAPTNGRAYFSNSDVTINTPWNVAANQSYVVFVHGNLTIANQIHVAEGGFLAFIVSGNITIDKSVGTAVHNSTVTQVEGVYIASGTFTVASNGVGDLKFVGGGTFVGWGGVALNRDYVPKVGNNANPTDLFQLRPDFTLNAPVRMSRALQLWQETN